MAVASSSKPANKMEVNPRGIPRAPFVDNVEDYVGGRDGGVQGIIQAFQETSSKYRYMELSLQQRRKALLGKIPDMENTLRVVEFLQQRRLKSGGEQEEDGEPLKSLFELNDTLYAEAEIEETGLVGIWLGASTMLLYPLEEAIELLSNKLAAARKSLDETVEDLEWLKQQATVMDVNFARVHNWDVKRRREQKAAEDAGAS